MIRTRLLKIGARITVSRRRIHIAFASVYPLQHLFAHVLAALRASPAPPDPAPADGPTRSPGAPAAGSAPCPAAHP